jgi:hypothetical protein
MEMKFVSIVWEWPERRGLEHLQLWESSDGAKAEGLVIVDAEEKVLRFRYSISLAASGQLRRCNIFVPVAGIQHSIFLSFDNNSNWLVNEEPNFDLSNCEAFDIRDTPFPKTLILRKLTLEVGQSKDIWVAYVDNRQLRVAPVRQTWQRFPTDEQGDYHYRCIASGISREYYVSEGSIVQFAPGQWRRTAPSPKAG